MLSKKENAIMLLVLYIFTIFCLCVIVDLFRKALFSRVKIDVLEEKIFRNLKAAYLKLEIKLEEEN